MTDDSIDQYLSLEKRAMELRKDIERLVIDFDKYLVEFFSDAPGLQEIKNKDELR